MNTKQMKAALAKVSPAKAKAVTTEPLSARVATTLGAVPSNTLGFFDAVATSFKYHEAARKGLL